MKMKMKNKFRLLSLLFIFGANSALKSQSVSLDLNDDYVEFPCINLANEFYNIRSNILLSPTDYKIISRLDNDLYSRNLYPEDCYMFSLPNQRIVTFKLNAGFDRTYVIRQNKVVYVSDVKIINEPPKRKQPLDINLNSK